ncbi:hypothetical protein [Arcicella lustrica]|uniref:YD repeat-containing protein n=1 Tax=Arcicella lustrica TaxID=2984196 RepID=A0ABU5SPF5_9BACT|nr:hypothetical protein [Arcicella sp. DC25W]MEA5429119.1 hypothetical protein [Arcicella sp. DC25W]
MNRIIKYSFKLLLISCCVSGYSQSKPSYKPDIIPPSPNASSITKFGDIPVSYYTGTANIDLPLYTIKDGSLQVPISLKYHPSGIRVAQEASQIGLGWALNAGGVIARTINGEDDFLSNGYLSKWSNNSLPLNSTPSPLIQIGYKTANLPSGSNYYFNYGATSVALDCNDADRPSRDYQPDSYSFNFPGGSGKFILTNAGEVILGEKSSLRIKKLNSSNILYALGGSVAWEITTPDGTKYLFDEKETYWPADDGSNGNYGKHVSSWYLKSITSVTGQLISFSYNYMTNGNSCSQASFYEKKLVTSISPTSGFVLPCTGGNNSSEMSIRYTQVVSLDKITFSNGYLKFNFGNRDDIVDDKKLESLEIYNNNSSSSSLLKTYLFNYDYFTGSRGDAISAGGCTSSNLKRLKLLSVDEKPVQGVVLRPYSFTYFESAANDTPVKTSYAIDHWGYFNGKFSNMTLIPTHSSISTSGSNNFEKVVKDFYGNLTGTERDTDPYFVNLFSLQKINYSTGGYTQFDYEAHDYDVANSKLKDHSFASTQPKSIEKNRTFSYNVQQKGIQQLYDIDLSKAITNNNANGNSSISITATVGLLLKNATMPCSNISGQEIYLELVNKTTNQKYLTVYVLNTPPCSQTNNTTPCTDRNCSSQFAVPTIIYKSGSISFPVGLYTVKATASDGTYHTLNNLDIRLSWYESEEAQPGAKSYAGGLRISKLTDYDGKQNIVKKFSYRTTEQINGSSVEKSTGRLMTMPQYTYCEPSSCEVNGTCSNAFDIYRASSPIIPLNASASGSIVGYDKVTVTYGENGESGKTVYTYDNQSDEVMNYGFYRPPTISSIPYFGNGNLLNQQDFKLVDGTYIKVHEVKNTYLSYSLDVLYGADARPTPIFLQGMSGCIGINYEYKTRFFYPALIQTVNYLSNTNELVY